MKKLFALLLASLLSIAASAQWVEGNTVGVRADNSKAPNAIFLNSATPTGPSEKVWHRISVASLDIPEDALSVFLSGMLIITHGYNPQTCDLWITFRAPGNDMVAGNYIGQTIETQVGGGIRSNMSTWAPVKNGEIEFYWSRNTAGPYPSECAYGINLSAQAYVR